MRLQLNEEERAFQREVRAFLDKHLTADLRRAGARTTSAFSDFDASLKWQKILYQQGWLVPEWPPEFGGTGWTHSQIRIFREECASAGTPALIVMGLLMLGPILMKYGSQQQQALLPRLLAGEDVWCQGYTEPSAGSDLASLQTRAVREGDAYIVNGTKIWTSYAHRANKIFCLVRTATSGKPQAGISFLLIDLDSAGITVRPIRGIDGEVEQCEVFLDNVRVPVANRVGEENQGWEIAKYLLEFERGNFDYYPTIKKQLRLIREMAAGRSAPRGGALLEDPVFAARLAEREIDTLALEYTECRIKSKLSAGESAGALSSLTKIVGTELGQQVDELALDARGQYLCPQQNAVLAPDYTGECVGPETGVAVMNYFLNNRASTIYGGTVQVQRNIIAKAVLGL